MNHENCPIRNVLAGLGDKWSLLVLAELREGTLRFSELLRALPDISQRMLTQTVRKHERDGLVRRSVTPSSPPKVEYELTELGHSLVKLLVQMSDWARENMPAIKKSRTDYDAAL